MAGNNRKLAAKEYDFDTLINYFNNKINQLHFIHSYKETSKNNSITQLIATIGIILTFFIILTTVINNSFTTQLNFYSSNFNTQYTLLSQIAIQENRSPLSNEIISGSMDVLNASSKGVVTLAEGQKYVNWILILMAVLLLFGLIGAFLIGKAYEKAFNENADEISSYSVIVDILTTIKVKHKGKITSEMEKELDNFQMPPKQYMHKLISMIKQIKNG